MVPTATILSYAIPQRRVPRWTKIALVGLMVWPIVAVGSVHEVYFMEWITHGERPYPLTNGANGIAEEVQYFIACFSYYFMPQASVFHALALFIFFPFAWINRSWRWIPLVVAIWFTAFAILELDPLGAVYFLRD